VIDDAKKSVGDLNLKIRVRRDARISLSSKRLYTPTEKRFVCHCYFDENGEKRYARGGWKDIEKITGINRKSAR
jgi:hypothetical protein